MTNAHSVGVAVIGGGMAGRAHAAGYRTASTLFSTDRPEVRLVAIADVNRAVAACRKRVQNCTSWPRQTAMKSHAEFCGA